MREALQNCSSVAALLEDRTGRGGETRIDVSEEELSADVRSLQFSMERLPHGLISARLAVVNFYRAKHPLFLNGQLQVEEG